MKKVLLVGFLTVFLAGKAVGDEYGFIVSVHDGDTVRVSTDTTVLKVRLAYIDAPELKQLCGKESRDHLAGWIGKKVRVRVLNQDRYGRSVGFVNCAGRDLSREQVECGLAWVYPQFVKRADLPEWQKAEGSAKSRHVGMWAYGSKRLQPPWEFRSKNKAP